MRIATIYQKIKRHSHNVIKHYETDLTVHDRRFCASMLPGDSAMWTCREHGTHFIWLSHHNDTPDHATLEDWRSRLNHFDAVASVFGNRDGAESWYLLECLGKPQHGTVVKLTADEARDCFVRKIKGLEYHLARKAA